MADATQLPPERRPDWVRSVQTSGARPERSFTAPCRGSESLDR